MSLTYSTTINGRYNLINALDTLTVTGVVVRFFTIFFKAKQGKGMNLFSWVNIINDAKSKKKKYMR